MTDPGETFRALHRPGDPFILANAWDAGSARMLAAIGAQALATSSAAHAFTLGLPDGSVTRDQALAHAQDLVAATSLPVQGDFEDGWGEDPDTVAETVRLSAEIGLAGICIEDVPGPGGDSYSRDLAIQRIVAGAAAARALPRDFVFCARADGVMTGAYDLDEAVARLRAFDESGADVLYVPMPGDLAALGRVVAATRKPVNALAAGPLASHRLDEFAKIGVARVSLGSALARVTHGAIARCAHAMFSDGDFTDLTTAMPGADVEALLRAGGA
ncbi:isocitrate lyase/phosphoenolpyruvate mutase family protein [Maribius pontilimi]|uniref:Isocitrate lyase/phosphoenolpyruvate mutase family protein n=1 Tax=Palleronia pontilimi TaxID=1964209 RepID=A0A934MAD7_9RHOB|nr:isocitrate lyase/phosphoenolpyruvate mutase family protein [Palleronia pontilimi]MBJ3763502.1 isocitrate lyase/phosphoenolpyruvate mutase family protein [Palleronia pontilimi]